MKLKAFHWFTSNNIPIIANNYNKLSHNMSQGQLMEKFNSVCMQMCRVSESLGAYRYLDNPTPQSYMKILHKKTISNMKRMIWCTLTWRCQESFPWNVVHLVDNGRTSFRLLQAARIWTQWIYAGHLPHII